MCVCVRVCVCLYTYIFIFVYIYRMRQAKQLPGPGEYGAPDNPAQLIRHGVKMVPATRRSASVDLGAIEPGPGHYMSNVRLAPLGLFLHALCERSCEIVHNDAWAGTLYVNVHLGACLCMIKCMYKCGCVDVCTSVCHGPCTMA